MIKRVMVCSVLLFIIMSSQAFCEEKSQKSTSGVTRQMPHKIIAPDFKLLGISGKVWRMSEHRGKVILLDFTTTWCPYCLKDIPFLKKIYAKYKDQGLEFVSINIQESQKKVVSFAEKHSIPYPVLLDPDGTAGMSYGVRGFPTKVLIDRDGTLICWMCNNDTLEKYLQKLLKK